MQQRVITFALLIGLFFSLVALGTSANRWRLPDNQQGYAPKQPIAFSHRLHAGELKLDCTFCHSNAEQSRHAGIPSTDVCMKCHQNVVNTFDIIKDEAEKAKEEKREPKQLVSEELQKLYDALNIEGLAKSDSKNKETIGKPIDWVRVHNLPDYVFFDHSAHVTVGVACQTCHGPVESFDRMHQEARLSMGWCVNCHREANEKGIDGKTVHASTNCSTCHY